jgi:hypothetical protein
MEKLVASGGRSESARPALFFVHHPGDGIIFVNEALESGI